MQYGFGIVRSCQFQICNKEKLTTTSPGKDPVFVKSGIRSFGFWSKFWVALKNVFENFILSGKMVLQNKTIVFAEIKQFSICDFNV